MTTTRVRIAGGLSLVVALSAALSSCGDDGGDSGSSNTGGSEPGGRASTGGNPGRGGSVTASGGKSVSGDTGGMAATGGRSGGTGGGMSLGDGICGAEKGQLFGPDHPWNQRIDAAPLDAESAAIIAYLSDNHTASQRFRVDGPSDEPNNLYGITILKADASTPRVEFEPSGDFYEPDCDPAPPPLPAGGAIEGETGYACENDGDCHLIVIDTDACRLYEMWRANRSGSSFEGGCEAVWDLRAEYEPTLRGDCCTSADAAGLPIAAHMFTADEVAAGVIPHAIRFILPNALMRERVYVRPATHSTGATSGPDDAPPYGARLRLKASFDESSLKPAARVVARALKEYGMILSDGGNLTFTAANDRFTTAKWADIDFGPGDLTSLGWDDFEVPELGERYVWDDSCECDRTPIED